MLSCCLRQILSLPSEFCRRKQESLGLEKCFYHLLSNFGEPTWTVILSLWCGLLCCACRDAHCCLRVSLKQSGHCPLTWTRHFHPKNCCSLSLLEHSLYKSNWWFFGKIPLDNQFLNGMAVGARWFGVSISKLLKSPFFLILQLFLFKLNILNLKQMFCTHIRWTEHGRGKKKRKEAKPPSTTCWEFWGVFFLYWETWPIFKKHFTSFSFVFLFVLHL